MIRYRCGRTLSSSVCGRAGVAAALACTASAVGGSWPFAFEFSTPQSITIPGAAEPRCTVVADIDEDGVADLIVAGSSGFEDAPSNIVWLLRGRGDGQFGAPESILVTPQPELAIKWGVVGELTGDNHLDLAVLSSEWIWVLRGDGKGGFMLIDSHLGWWGHRQLVAADFDNDGDLDLAATNLEGNYVWVRYNDGFGQFDILFLASMSKPHFLVAGDFNGDGWTDLATGQLLQQTIRLLINDGAGFPDQVIPLMVGFGPTGLAAADLDEDGDLDLVVAGMDSRNGSINFLENLGGAEFVPSRQIEYPKYSLSGAPWFLACADFNGDGLLDVVVTEALSNAIKVFPNESFGSLSFGLPLPIEVGSFPYSVIAANLDDDCDHDIVVANVAGLSISVLLNQTSEVGTCAVADLTLDAVVDMQDATVVISAWGELASAADLNYDGLVNGFDLATVLGHWDPAR